MKSNEQGYTVIELIVAMGLIAIITTFAYAMYTFNVKMIKGWRERIHLENTAHYITNAIANDLLTIRTIEKADEKSITFINCRNEIREYSFIGKTIQKDKRTIVPKDITVSDFTFDYKGFDSNQLLPTDQVMDFEKLDTNLNNVLEGNELKALDLIEVNMTLTSGIHQFNLKTVVSLRNKNFIDR